MTLIQAVPLDKIHFFARFSVDIFDTLSLSLSLLLARTTAVSCLLIMNINQSVGNKGMRSVMISGRKQYAYCTILATR